MRSNKAFFSLWTILTSMVLPFPTPLFAQNGDTTIVQTFTFDAQNNPQTAYDSPGRRWFNFPSSNNGKTYQKILMLHSLKCFSEGTAGGLGYPCGEWDYLTYNNLFEHTGQLDSNLLSHPHYLLNNEDFVATHFQFAPTQNYIPFLSINSVNDNWLNLSTTVLNENVSLAMSAMGNGRRQLSQFIITASQLNSAGLSAGFLQGLSWPQNNADQILYSATVSLGSTNLSLLNGNFNGPLTEVFHNNLEWSAGNQVNIVFNTPYYWDGVSNLVVCFYHTYASGASTGIEAMVNNNIIGQTSINDHYLRLNGNDKIEIPAAAFSNLSDEVTISFWLRGDANAQPENGTCFEAKNANNQRILNTHIPWSNSRVYWDAGFSGSYDRIDKAANPADYEGVWNHWSFVKNNNTGEMKIYLNGFLWHSGTNLTKSMAGIVQFSIGSACTWSNYYRGDIDDFQIFGAALDAATIQNWMNKRPNVNHPNYGDLLIYYDFDQIDNTVNDQSPNNHDGIIQGNPLFVLYDKEEIFKNFEEIPFPALTFYSGNGAIMNDTIQQYIPYEQNPDYLTSFVIDHHAVQIESSTAVYTQPYSFYYDINGNVSDSLANLLINFSNDTLWYYSAPAEVIHRYELGRYITPYGINLDLQDGWTWIFDVTDFAPLLRDSVQLEAGNWQELLDLKFLFIEGPEARHVTRLQNVWQGNWGLSGFDNYVTTKNISLNPDESAVKLRTTLTGHGFGNDVNNCGEFCYNTHYLKVNGQNQFQWEIMEECDQNPLYPQGGTWIYARAGWCPGKEGTTREFELTPFLQNGAVDVDYDITYDPYGNYVTESQAVFYGPNLQGNDVSLESILSPSTTKIYSRWNPICDNAHVVIKNKGANPIQSLTFHYGFSGSGINETFEWTGNLAFDERADVFLPFENSQIWNLTTNELHGFFVDIVQTNDENPSNNHGYSSFIAPPIYTYLPNTDDNRLIIYLRTNGAYNESSYQLKDIDGNVVFERTGFDTPNFTYKDTLRLNAGCYTFHLKDSDGDGLNFFANDDGNGYSKFDRVSGGDFIMFERDFGEDIVHSFRFETNLIHVDEVIKNYFPIQVYPNPAQDHFTIRWPEQKKPIQITITDAKGKIIRQEMVSAGIGQLALDADWSAGLYLIQINANEKHYTRRMVVE
ncbi:MAG: hypothetical protein RLY35_99 [Bacteroidota bacterium]